MKILSFKDFYEIINGSSSLVKKGYTVKETVLFEHPKAFELKVELLKNGISEMIFVYAKMKEGDSKIENVLKNQDSNVKFKEGVDDFFYITPFNELSRKEQVDILYKEMEGKLSNTMQGKTLSLEDYEFIFLTNDGGLGWDISKIKELSLNYNVKAEVMFDFLKTKIIKIQAFVKQRYQNKKSGKEIVKRFLINEKVEKVKLKEIEFQKEKIIFTKNKEIFTLESKCSSVQEAIALIRHSKTNVGFKEISSNICKVEK